MCSRTVGAACDDGNQCTTGDTCTSSACHGDVVPDGTACSDGTACTSGDVCVGGACQGAAASCPPCESCDLLSGLCVGAPRPACRTSAAPAKSILEVRNTIPDTKDALRWTWPQGPATTLADLGDPVTTDDYALCLFAGSAAAPSRLLRAEAPAGGTCAGKPCWKVKGAGFGYKDKEATPAGLTAIVLRPGDAGKAKVTVKGKGPLLSTRLPPLPLLLPLRLQLQGEHGGCFETRYEASGVLVNDGARGKFKARGAP